MKTLGISNIIKSFHKIDEALIGDDYVELWEHNIFGDEDVLCISRKYNTACYTNEDLFTTVENEEDYTWFKIC